ncbi:MAG: glycoside hydrolase family 88 protein [Marinoscillum sp.]
MKTTQVLHNVLWFALVGILACQPKVPELKINPEEVGNRVAADLLTRSEFMIYDTPGVYSVHYAEACAAYGALKFAGLVGDDRLIQQLITRYQRVKSDSIPNTENHVDTNVYGILPLEIFLQTGDSSYLEEGLALADGQWSDTLPNGLTSQTRYWIDDIFMIAALQVQAYRSTNETVYLDRAALTVDTYIQKLQQSNGLFHHGPEAPFFWGRGNGWVAAGLAILLSELPEANPHYTSILEGYTRMMETLLAFQAEDGMWHQLIDDPSSFKESSSTAMFGYAMITGVNRGLLSRDIYAPAYVKAWNALAGYLNEDGKIREICVGTGQSLEAEYYLNRPRVTGDLHGQAPMLWFACGLMEE